LVFAARELDATAGLYCVRARGYYAGMGRFIGGIEQPDACALK
jgi:hypothetical protein